MAARTCGSAGGRGQHARAVEVRGTLRQLQRCDRIMHIDDTRSLSTGRASGRKQQGLKRRAQRKQRARSKGAQTASAKQTHATARNRTQQGTLHASAAAAKKSQPGPVSEAAVCAAVAVVQPAKHAEKYCCPSLPHLCNCECGHRAQGQRQGGPSASRGKSGSVQARAVTSSGSRNTQRVAKAHRRDAQTSSQHRHHRKSAGHNEKRGGSGERKNCVHEQNSQKKKQNGVHGRVGRVRAAAARVARRRQVHVPGCQHARAQTK